MAKYVYSTLTASQVYSDGENKVLIVGGANSPTKHMLTPRGVATKVTDEQMAILEKSGLFKKHQERGFIEVSTFSKDADKVAKGMTAGDKSAPDTEEKLKAEGKEAPAKGKK